MANIFSNLGAFGKENSILNQFLFPAPRSSYSWASFPGELVCLVGREGNVVPCTIMPGVTIENSDAGGKMRKNIETPATCLAIYCHANGEDLGVLNDAGHWLCDTLGVHMLIPEYPGYGMAPGTPHEASVTRNVETAYDFAVNALHWDPKHILLIGRSIGTGVAVKLAAKFECGALILVSPYTSVKDMVRTHAGIVTSWLTAELPNMFDSEHTIDNVPCPTLFVHGVNDHVIPAKHSERLHSASKAANKRLVLLEGIGHHGIDLHLAVAHECSQLLTLNGCPKVLNLDQFLFDPMLQGDTVASPVPAFDLRNMSWSRPMLSVGSTPYLRDVKQPGIDTEVLMVDMSSYWTYESQGRKQVITDEVLMSRLLREGLSEEERDFFHADRLEKMAGHNSSQNKGSSNGATRFARTPSSNSRFYFGAASEALKGGGKSDAFKEVGKIDTTEVAGLSNGGTDDQNSAHDSTASTVRTKNEGYLTWRTDTSGQVVEDMSWTPDASDQKLFIY